MYCDGTHVLPHGIAHNRTHIVITFIHLYIYTFIHLYIYTCTYLYCDRTHIAHNSVPHSIAHNIRVLRHAYAPQYGTQYIYDCHTAGHVRVLYIVCYIMLPHSAMWCGISVSHDIYLVRQSAHAIDQTRTYHAVRHTTCKTRSMQMLQHHTQMLRI